MEYQRNKRRDSILAITDQVAFFREKILSESEKLNTFVKNEKNDQDFVWPRIQLDDPENINNKYRSLIEKQIAIAQLPGVFEKQRDILNMLEELSIRIIYTETTLNPGLASIRLPFIECIEIFAYTLFYYRATGVEYPAVFKLYISWKDLVDRTPTRKKLSKS
jgi:hypothetical protein